MTVPQISYFIHSGSVAQWALIAPVRLFLPQVSQEAKTSNRSLRMRTTKFFLAGEGGGGGETLTQRANRAGTRRDQKPGRNFTENDKRKIKHKRTRGQTWIRGYSRETQRKSEETQGGERKTEERRREEEDEKKGLRGGEIRGGEDEERRGKKKEEAGRREMWCDAM